MDRGRLPKARTQLESKLALQLNRRKLHARLRVLELNSRASVDFSSNDFLSLATTPRFRQDYLSELQKNTFPIGSMGSRLLDGNSGYAESLETEIAMFHGAESGLLTNSGFDANVSIFVCLPQPGDVIVYDELIHASVHDGMKKSRAINRRSFKHNCARDLRHVLQSLVSNDSNRNIFVAVESVYSMDGDLAPLQEFASVIEQTFPARNCHLIVDEAHATGVYGPQGRGRVSELGLEKQVLVRLHTFGKALGCNGAIILCSDVIKLYLLNYARPLIYTTFMPYSSLSAIKVAYDWLQAGKTEESAVKLFHLIEHLHARLQDLRLSTSPYVDDVLTVPSICPNSPIFALVTNDPWALAAHCQAAGFLVRAVVAPTVPEGTERVRVCLHAGNTFEQIDSFVGCVRRWVQQQTAVLELPSIPGTVPQASLLNNEREVAVDQASDGGIRAKL